MTKKVYILCIMAMLNVLPAVAEENKNDFNPVSTGVVSLGITPAEPRSAMRARRPTRM